MHDAPMHRMPVEALPSQETVAILERLIAFPTVSSNSNLDLIGWVEAYLARFGVACRLTHDASRRKASLFATIGEGKKDGLVLSGHTDVVPVDGQDWSSDPFAATQREGRIHGRGAADMKGFIAAVLAAVPDILAADRSEPIHVALSHDEEVGCIGVGGLLEDIAAIGIAPRGCIIGEPTDMAVVIGHKGSSVYRCTVRGHEAHSSLAPHGVNAIEYASKLIVRLYEIQQRLKAEERRHDGFDVPFTTLSAGLIAGGIASNIVPRDCEFRFDVRYLPWTPPETIVAELEAYAQSELLPQMQRVAPESAIAFERMGNVLPLHIEETAALPQYVQRLLGSRRPAGYVGFGTEGGLFQQFGIPCVICGPGSIEQAHKPDEFITLVGLARCEHFLRRLIADEVGPH